MTPAEQRLQVALKRSQDALKAIRERSTVIERWEDTGIDSKAAPLWNARAQAAARLIAPGMRVADIGCYTMVLERHLPEGCSYVPVDVIRRDARTIAIDLNRDPLALPEVDLIVALGLLEYLHDLPRFFSECRQAAPEALFSYHPLELSPERNRLNLGWVNALNSCEILALLRNAGYHQIQVERYQDDGHFYRASGRLARLPPPAPPDIIGQ